MAYSTRALFISLLVAAAMLGGVASGQTTPLPDSYYFVVYLKAGQSTPSVAALAHALSGTVVPGQTASVTLRLPTRAGSWSYEFAFVGSNADTLMGAFVDMGGEREAALVNATTVTALAPPDEFFFAVYLLPHYPFPTEATLSDRLRSLNYSWPTPEVYLRNNTQGTTSWSYEFAFIGPRAGEYFGALAAVGPFGLGRLLNASEVTPLVPGDEWFFAVWLAPGARTPSDTNVSIMLHALSPRLDRPEVYVRKPSQATAQWSYEFAFVGNNAARYMDAFVSLTPQLEAHALNAQLVSALLPDDSFFFTVRLESGRNVPKDTVLAAELSTLVTSLPTPEIFIRDRTQSTGRWDYEFAFIGPNGGAYMDAFVAVGAAREAQLLNASSVTALVPPATFFFAVFLNDTHAYPSDKDVAAAIAVLSRSLPYPEIYMRKPSVPNARWQYEFAIVGPAADRYLEKWVAVGPDLERMLLKAKAVTALVPPDEYFFTVRLAANAPVPNASTVEHLLAPLKPNGEVPTIYYRTASQSSGAWQYEFAFIGMNAGDNMGAFVALGATGEASLLHAQKVTGLVPGNEFFFTVRLFFGGKKPSNLALSRSLHRLIPSQPAPEVYMRAPSVPNARWAYEFAFVGPTGGEYMTRFLSLTESSARSFVNASYVGPLIPPDAFFIAVTLNGGFKVPSDTTLSRTLGAARIGAQEPEVYLRAPSVANAGWSYEFAFIGPDANTCLTGFSAISETGQRQLLNASRVEGLVPSNSYFFEVRLFPANSKAPSEQAVAKSVLSIAPSAASLPVVIVRPPSLDIGSRATYEFAFVGTSANMWMLQFIAIGPQKEAEVLNATYVGALVPPDAYIFQARKMLGGKTPSPQAVEWSLSKGLGMRVEIFFRLPSVKNAKWTYEFGFIGPTAATAFAKYAQLTPKQERAMINASYVGPIVPSVGYYVVKLRPDHQFMIPTTGVLVEAIVGLATGPLMGLPEVYIRDGAPGDTFSYEFACVGPDTAYCQELLQQSSGSTLDKALNATAVYPAGSAPKQGTGDEGDHKGATIAIAIVVTLILFGAILAVLYVFRQRQARRRAHIALMDPSSGHDAATDTSSVRASMNEYGYSANAQPAYGSA